MKITKYKTTNSTAQQGENENLEGLNLISPAVLPHAVPCISLAYFNKIRLNNPQILEGAYWRTISPFCVGLIPCRLGNLSSR
jgi:hypothetical protein